MQKGLVLCIDDDENLQFVIKDYLESDGYEVDVAGNAETALAKLDAAQYDVILLDLVLPDGEGLTLIPRFKAITKAAIIVVSGKVDTTEKIICLEMGADDYITKPFEMRELSARIKAVKRRMGDTTAAIHTQSSESQDDKLVLSNNWYILRSQYQLFDENGKSADLTTGEFKLLEALVLSANRALSRERLFDLTRDGEFDAYDRAIDIQIARLRKKLNDDTKTPKIIKTVRGVGYMYSANS